MATAELKPVDTTSLPTKEEAVAKFGNPVDGYRYMVKDGKVQIGQDGKPITLKKKAGGTRNKPKKPIFPVPAGKLRSSDTPGFDISSHARLKVTDFADPLDHAKWLVWFYGENMKNAEQNVKNIAALGNTPDERKAAADKNRLITAMENLGKRTIASGTAAEKSAMMERLGKLFAELQSS